MKLYFCKKCEDVRKMHSEKTTCACGSSGGRYMADGVSAEITGEAIPIGILNTSFLEALCNRPESGEGSRFEAFVIPTRCPSVTKPAPLRPAAP